MIIPERARLNNDKTLLHKFEKKQGTSNIQTIEYKYERGEFISLRV